MAENRPDVRIDLLSKFVMTRLSSVLGLLGGLLPILAILSALFWGRFVTTGGHVTTPAEITFSKGALEIQEASLKEVTARLEKDEAAINALSKSPPTNSALAAQLNGVQSVLTNTSTQVDALNKAIMASPEKALEIPLLQRDLQSVKDNDQASIAALREEINRLYGLGEWFFGLMFTMAIGIISLAVTNLLRPAAKEGLAK